MSASRTAGALLLLTALATAISVLFRLSAGADQTPMAESLGQSMGLDSERIAQLAAAETLSAIGAAKSAYAAGGAARLVAGLALLAASIPLWRVAGPYHARAMGLAAALLAASGIISAVSGGCAMALAALAAETQSSVALVPGADLIGRVEDTLLTMRWAFGALGFTLGGLGLVALAPVQWRIRRPRPARFRGRVRRSGGGNAAHLGGCRYCIPPHNRHRLPDLADSSRPVADSRAREAAYNLAPNP